MSSLIDLKSDLSKFRSVFSKEHDASFGPEVSKAKSHDNFAAVQPISAKLEEYSGRRYEETSRVDHRKSLDRTILDEIRPFEAENILINKVSRLSLVGVIDKSVGKSVLTLSDIAKNLPDVNKFETVSHKDSTVRINLAKQKEENPLSNILINRASPVSDPQSPTLINKTNPGENNTTSAIPITPATQKNEFPRSPIEITPSNLTSKKVSLVEPRDTVLTDNKELSSVDPQEMSTAGVTDPNTPITTVPLTFTRNSATIDTTLKSPIGNVVDPKTILQSLSLTQDKGLQSPELFNTLIQSPIVNPNIDVIRVNYDSRQLEDNSRLNRDGQPVRFVGNVSRVVDARPSNDLDGIKYDGESQMLIDTSKFNIDGKPTPTIPTGRHETDTNTLFSTLGGQEVNFFDDTYGAGFTRNLRLGQTQLATVSKYGWVGNPPESDYFANSNASGFSAFARKGITEYNVRSSEYGFDVPTGTDYFDQAKRHSVEGFKTFVVHLETDYKVGASDYSFDQVAPTADYFDISKQHTTEGFHQNAQLYDTKYKLDSSIYGWEGGNQEAPEYDYFDLTRKNTTKGFHRFAQRLDTAYIVDSSEYDWDGPTTSAPSADYFDLARQHTTEGFHTFAQLYDSKYVKGSSVYDWDGPPQSAPQTDFFDLRRAYQSEGFHKFARLHDTKYIRDASQFDWDGPLTAAPSVDFFDFTRRNSTEGFHTFAQKFDTKYKVGSSYYDWDGNRNAAPEVDFFDLSRRHTTEGFHKFAQHLDTKYIKDSSRFDWDGPPSAAPTTNFFLDVKGTGFSKFAPHLLSEYKKDVSPFVFKGTEPAPANFFTNLNATGFTNRMRLHDTKYFKDSSTFGFAGGAEGAPSANYFVDNVARGFTKFAPHQESEYRSDASRFSFRGPSLTAPSVDFLSNIPAEGFTTFSTTSAYNRVSRYTWTGTRDSAPSVDFFGIVGDNPKAVRGFSTFFTNKTDSKLSYEYSSLSFAGTKRTTREDGFPYTNFFGFTPSERTGFMIKMTQFDGTLYPIIQPRLRNDDPNDIRYRIESAREQQKRLQTGDTAKYAPNSLGPRPWLDGSLLSTLEMQIPNLKNEGAPGAFNKKYYTEMKNVTNGYGYLTTWAKKRRSPSEIDDQYNKYNLREDSYNPDPIWAQPFVLRGMQAEGEVEPQRWAEFIGGFDDGLVRAGAVTQAERILADEQRIGKFLSSGKGLLWIGKQLGLQAMNPAVDVDPNTPTSGILGVSSTLVFNPLSIPANVASARAGIHLARHGLLPFDSGYLNKYETATFNRELNLRFLSPFARKFDGLEEPTVPGQQTNYNRLIGLMKELLPGAFMPNVDASSAPAIGPPTFLGNVIDLVKKLTGKTGIARISSNFGGAQSFLGVGGTTINRAKHPYLTHYTTAPNLGISANTDPNQFVGPPIPGTNISQREPQYPDSAKRDIHYAQTETYGDVFKNNNGFSTLKGLAYHLDNGPREMNDNGNFDPPRDVQPHTLTKIEKLDVFNPKYEYLSDRVEAKNENNSDRVGNELAQGPNDQLVDLDNPIKRYRTTNYDGLRRNNRRGNRYYNDFRANIDLDDTTKAYIGDPDFARFDTRNLEERYGFGFQGEPGSQRDTPFLTNVQYKKFDSKKVLETDGPSEFRDYAVSSEKNLGGAITKFRGDRINIIDYKRANFNINKNLVYEKGEYTDGIKGTDDLIEFYFSGLVLSGHAHCPAETIVFRATFGNITDTHQPSWNSVKYMGRADPLYVYQSYEREISFDFQVHIGSRDEMKASWRKLNYLASWTAPEYIKSGQIRGPMVRLNIGHLYRKMPGYISSLSYTFDNTQHTWETARLPEDMNLDSAETREASNPGVLQLPKHITVNVSFVPVGVYRPEFRGVMYSLFDDTNGAGSTGIESGLIPKDTNKVNYFKEFDELSGEPVIYSGYDLNGDRRTPYDESPTQDIELEEPKSNFVGPRESER